MQGLLVQCTVAEASAAAELADGLVISGPRAIQKALALQSSGYQRPIFCDAAAYAGTRRRPARAAFDNRWLRWQLDRGPALTDSGYVGKLDVRGLSSILHRTMRLGPGAIATLPLHADWLRAPSDREILLSEVAYADVPIAVAVEHQADPLGVRAVVAGLVDVLALDVPVMLLRSDVSAVGALCFGASWAAVGTSTSLRHIYPVVSGGGFRTARVAAFSPHLLAYLSVDKLAAAVHLTPDLAHLWSCECTTCNGRPLDWLATLRSGVPAFRHSIEQLCLLRDSFLGTYDLRRAWLERCNAAAALHAEIRSGLPEWRTPPFLNAWRHTTTPLLADLPTPINLDELLPGVP